MTVEYALTPMGRTLPPVIDGLRGWSMAHIQAVTRAREAFDDRSDDATTLPEEEK